MKLNLPVEFLDLCEQYHTDPETVLRGFIADLSDERNMARDYFQRCGYGVSRRVGR